MPEPAILANVLYHSHNIIASAKQQAADAFLDSARFAGALGDDFVFRPHGPAAAEPAAPPAPIADPAPTYAQAPQARDGRPRAGGDEVRIDVRLWDEDHGKVIRVRAPESITPASLDRFLQAFRLLVRVEEPPAPLAGADQTEDEAEAGDEA